MGRVGADGEYELHKSFVVYPAVAIGKVMGELCPDTTELGRVELQAAGCAPGFAVELLLNTSQLKGVVEYLQPVIARTRPPAAVLVNPLNIRPVLMTLERVYRNKGTGRISRGQVAVLHQIEVLPLQDHRLKAL